MTAADDARPPRTPRAAALVRIVGCGRRFRRDDQAGLIVADALALDPPPGSSVESSESPLADLSGSPPGTDVLVVIDACAASRELLAGRWRRVEYRGGNGLLRPHGGGDTHSISVETALELAFHLGTAPDLVWIYALAGADFGYGESLTPGVAAAIGPLTARIRNDVIQWRRSRELVSQTGEEATHARAVHRASAG